MPRLVRPALPAILEASDGIQNAVRSKTRDDFAADWRLTFRIDPTENAVVDLDYEDYH